MRIAYFLTEFPAISQPFVLYQIIGALERGHEVKLFVPTFTFKNKEHNLIRQYALIEKSVSYHDYPKNFFERAVFAVGRVLKSGLWKSPLCFFRAINIVKYGRDAWSLKLLIASCQVYSARNDDVLHCQFANLGPFVSKLKSIGVLSGRLLVSARGFDITKYVADRPGFYDDLFRDAELFLPVSESLKQTLLDLGGDEKKIEVIHSGMNVGDFAFVEHRLDGTRKVSLLSVGRLVEKKGFEYAIRAVGALVEQGMDVEYIIIGGGAELDTLTALVSMLNLQNVVIFKGACSHDEVKQHFSDADIFLAPSVVATDGDQEGIPNVLKEAMALGVPVISTYHSGIPELVEHEVSGLLVAERDVVGLVQAIKQMLNHKEKTRAMTFAAREKVVAEFDNNMINARLNEIYLAKDTVAR